MSRFYSIPGTSIRQRSEHSDRVQLPPLEANPNLREWVDSRQGTSHTTVGIDGKNLFRGDPALVHGEEHDKHSGEVHQYVQRSDATGSGTYRNVWKPGDGPRQMVLAESKRIHE